MAFAFGKNAKLYDFLNDLVRKDILQQKRVEGETAPVLGGMRQVLNYDDLKQYFLIFEPSASKPF